MEPYHDDHIFTRQGSYFKPVGDYQNGTTFIGAQVYLSCLYGQELGEKMRILDREVDKIKMTCTYDFKKQSSYWIWTNPINQSNESTLPECLMKCLRNPPTRNDLWRTWNKLKWLDVEVSYRCKDKTQLFVINNSTGYKYAKSRCKSYYGMEPWWEPSVFPQCVKGLTEVSTPSKSFVKGRDSITKSF